MSEGIEQTAAKCTARLFHGWGHKIRTEGDGALYQAQGADQFTEFEKKTLTETFYFFMDLMEGNVPRGDIKPPEKGQMRGYRSD